MRRDQRDQRREPIVTHLKLRHPCARCDHGMIHHGATGCQWPHMVCPCPGYLRRVR